MTRQPAGRFFQRRDASPCFQAAACAAGGMSGACLTLGMPVTTGATGGLRTCGELSRYIDYRNAHGPLSGNDLYSSFYQQFRCILGPL